jgi:hypothetical protein
MPTTEEFTNFKQEVRQAQKSMNKEILDLRSENDAFSKEKIEMLKRIEKIDWGYTGVVKLVEQAAEEWS